MNNITITPFRLTHLPAIQKIERACFSPTDAYDMGEIISLWLGGRDTFRVARLDNRVVGYIAGIVSVDTGYIASVAVLPDYWGRGLGRQLVEAVMERMADKGASRFELHVRHDNAAAIHLYHNLGFVERETIPHFYGLDQPGILMVKERT